MGYIFSDKTGTLTRNVMEFKMCKIGIYLYGEAEDLDESVDVNTVGRVKRKVTSKDLKSGVEYAFESEELNNCLKGLTE